MLGSLLQLYGSTHMATPQTEGSFGGDGETKPGKHSTYAKSSQAPVAAKDSQADPQHGSIIYEPSSGIAMSTRTLSSAGSSASSSGSLSISPTPSDSSSQLNDLSPATLATPMDNDEQQWWPATTATFHKWRPSYHVIAPYGWMNDPCAAFWDENTDLFHLFYEWNPHGSSWGNMSWGHVTSPDLVRWTRVDHKDEPDALPAPRDSVEHHLARLSAGDNSPKRYGRALEPKAAYDALGIFTGCAVTRPQAHESSSHTSQITAFYTSVSHLPIHHTLPYTRGSESLSIATSDDGGKSWRRLEGKNPILEGPPAHLEVTAWRDPYVAAMPALDAVMGRAKGQYLYGIIAGGLRVREGTPTTRNTPTAFLYSVPADDLTTWRFESTLFDLGYNLPQGSEQGDWGRNFEVCNVFGLDSPAADDWVVAVINAEACLSSSFNVQVPQPKPMLLDGNAAASEDDDEVDAFPHRLPRRAMWMRASLHASPEQTGPTMQPQIGGPLDWGCLYAANTFEDASLDPERVRRVMWGWIPDDDLSTKHSAAQGWQGCLALPRQLTVQEVHAAVPSSSSNAQDYIKMLKSFGNFDVQVVESAEDNERARIVVRTLGIQPVPEVLNLRDGLSPRATTSSLQPEQVSALPRVLASACSGKSPSHLATHTLGTTSRNWEAELTLDLDDFAHLASHTSSMQVGVMLAHTSDVRSGAAIVYDLTKSTLVLHRACSTPHKDINTTAVDGGPLRLLHLPALEDPAASDATPYQGRSRLEPLTLRIFLDNSVLEVFANGRWACSSRIYPDCVGGGSDEATADGAVGNDTAVGLSLFALYDEPDGVPAASSTPPSLQIPFKAIVWECLPSAFGADE